MSRETHQHVAFDAMRQFVIAPDRRYRVESDDVSLRFRKTGSQFDRQWLARGARPMLGDEVAEKLERASRSKLIVGGIGLAAAAAVVLLLFGAFAATTDMPLRRAHFTGLGALVFAFVLGLVMTIAGIASRRAGASQSGHDLELPFADILDATLLPPQSELARRGEPQVARVHLQPRSGRPIRLGIPTDADLEAAKGVIPKLAA